jgi:hypothetical protein
MASYLPIIIWTVSAIACHFIARSRNVKTGFIRTLVAVLLGPLAIPLVFLVKPEETPEGRC